MAALTHKIPLLLISINALFLSAHAQYSYDDEDGSPASYISLTPEASPAAAPGYSSSLYISSAPDASPVAAPVAVESVDTSSTTEESSSSTGAAAGLDNVNPVVSYGVPQAGDKKGINKFVKSTMEASMTKTDSFISTVIGKKLKDPEIDPYSKDCLVTCKDVYEESMGAMKKTIEDVDEENYFKANVDVSAISNDADVCKECVKDVFGEDPDFDKFNKWIDGVIDDCLDKITGVSA